MPNTGSFIAFLIAGPGLFILGWASFTLLAWAYGRESTLPFERVASDELRLVRAGLDVTYGIVPIAISVGCQFFAWHAISSPSVSILLITVAGAIGYSLMYYSILRPSLAKHRLAIRTTRSR